MRRVLPLIAGLILGLGLGIILYFGFIHPDAVPGLSQSALGTQSLPFPDLNQPAPEFELRSLSGEKVRLEDYRGKVILLNFWATWCAPCRLEMPALQSRADLFANTLAVVAINNAEETAVVESFVDELDLSFEVLLDPEAEVQQLYRVRGYPTTYLLDTAGIIRIQHIGLLTEKQLDGYLQDLGVKP